MAQQTSPLLSISVSPFARLIARTAYHSLLDVRNAPPHPEPTVLDFLVSVQGLTGWIFAQQNLRQNHAQKTHDNIEAFLWEREAARNDVVLSRTLLEKSNARWVRSQEYKERQKRRGRESRKRSDLIRDGSSSLEVDRVAWGQGGPGCHREFEIQP
jgi:hypothetical protein